MLNVMRHGYPNAVNKPISRKYACLGYQNHQHTFTFFIPQGTVSIIISKNPTATFENGIEPTMQKSKTFAPCFLHHRHERITRVWQNGCLVIPSNICS
jgi:hypothetical protein